jgi:hypothetical protein
MTRNTPTGGFYTTCRAIRKDLAGEQTDLVITDIPYGIQSEWQGHTAGGGPVWQMLETLAGVLTEGSVVAIASTKELLDTPK